MKFERNRKASESGSAFVISILILFVLSVLGMALMLTTTTETDISVNYRWGEMAFFNADAALEYGKNILAAYALRDGDLRHALPRPRGPGGMTARPQNPDFSDCGYPPPDGCRDYQYALQQDVNTTVYIGMVLRDPNTTLPIMYDFRSPSGGAAVGNIDSEGAADVDGTVTIWVRRPITGNEDYGFSTGLSDRAILTAEGTAPNFNYTPNSARPGSMRRLEMTVSLASSSSVAGDRYSDPTKGSQQGDAIEGSWSILQQVN
jgi:hypothetical protein